MTVHNITWAQVWSRVADLTEGADSFYGVPRGGSIVAGLTGHAVDTPEEADYIIDDIVDSGRTRNKWMKKFPDKGFLALYDKTGADKDVGWLVFPWEGSAESDGQDIILRQLQFIAEDSGREGLVETPARVIKSWDTLYSGYKKKPEDIIKTFTEGACDEMVVLKNIEFYSTCEHHMLPFFGKAHVAYIPKGKVIGVSKLARLLDIFARRLQIQERIGQQVTDALMEHLQPLGAACIIEAKHLCMCCRGVAKQNSTMVTSSLKGVFMTKPEARAELMRLIG